MNRFEGGDTNDFFGRPGPASERPRPEGSNVTVIGQQGQSHPRPRQAMPEPRFDPQPRLASGPRRSTHPPRVDSFDVQRRTMRRLVAFAIVVLMAMSAVSLRLVDISRNGGQTCRTDQVADCRAYGANLRAGLRPLPAGRGAIYDRNGQPFALSTPQPNVVADPRSIGAMAAEDPDVPDPAETAAALAPILDLDEADLAQTLTDPEGRYALLAPTVSPDVATEVREVIEDEKLVGIAFEDHPVRERPSDGLARAIVGKTYDRGLVGDDGRRGQTGLELALDDELEGTPGTVRYEKDVSGGTIAGSREQVNAAVPGTDVYLTLDQSLQYAAEQAVTDQVEATGAQQGMAVITRPSTGDVLAMVSVADDGSGIVANTGDNRPVSTVFEPGSVNKVITLAGAIEDGVVDPDTVFEVPDELQVADHRFSDHDPHPDEAWSVTDILVTSSNIGTIKIAQELGEERMDHYLRSFGFGSATSDQFPGEVDGLMLDQKDWSGTSIGAIPIGQGLSVTALQMLAAYNVVANDGIAVAPRLIGARDEGEGRRATPPSEQRQVISPDTARAMSTMLTKVVADGTGRSAQVPGYPTAGKTGTARIPQEGAHLDPNDAYQDAEGNYHYESSFVGFVPGADLSIIVTIQDAETSIYGSEVAAPLFARLAALALRKEAIPPPSLVEVSSPAVPDLSPSARRIDGEGPGPNPRDGQG